MNSVNFRILSMLTASICVILLGNTSPNIDNTVGERLTSEMQEESEIAISIINSEFKQIDEIIYANKSVLTFKNKKGVLMTMFIEESSIGIYNKETEIANFIDLNINDLNFIYDSNSNKVSVKVNTKMDVRYNLEKAVSYTGYSEKEIKL